MNSIMKLIRRLTMKKHGFAILMLIVALTLTACSNEKGLEIAPNEDIFEANVDPETVYNEALRLQKSGDDLHAMQLFMSVYDYRDAHSKYNGMLMASRISISDSYVGIVTDNGMIASVGNVNFLGEPFDEAPVLDSWTSISAISSHSLGTIGLTKDGYVLSTTDTTQPEEYGGAGTVNTWSQLEAIACGDYHTLGLKDDGTVVSTQHIADSKYNKGQYNVNRWSDIVAIAAGAKHSLGLKSDGTVVSCGDNSEGQCNVDRWTDIVQISANSDYSAGLKSDGTVLVTGDSFLSSEIDVSDWTDIVSISIGYAHVVGLKSDGSVVASGHNYMGECDVSTWKNMRAIMAGGNNTLGVSRDGTIFFVGTGTYNREQINGYSIFTGLPGDSSNLSENLPDSFPADIPLLENKGIIKVSETGDRTVVVFETTAEFDDAFSYYEEWCSGRGGYIKQPYDGGLDMLITPIHDIEKSASIIVTKGITEEYGIEPENCAIIIMLQGGESYNNVASLK